MRLFAALRRTDKVRLSSSIFARLASEVFLSSLKENHISIR
jgi:hypothetical protein